MIEKSQQDSIRKRYQSFSTDNLLYIYRNANPTQVASSAIKEELFKRGLTEESLQKVYAEEMSVYKEPIIETRYDTCAKCGEQQHGNFAMFYYEEVLDHNVEIKGTRQVTTIRSRPMGSGKLYICDKCVEKFRRNNKLKSLVSLGAAVSIWTILLVLYGSWIRIPIFVYFIVGIFTIVPPIGFAYNANLSAGNIRLAIVRKIKPYAKAGKKYTYFSPDTYRAMGRLK